MALSAFPNITHQQIVAADICQLIPSFLSMVACTVSLYLLRRIPRSALRFRHSMIRLILLSDLMRAVLQFIFPWFNINAIVRSHTNSKFLTSDVFPFCDFVGFMVNYSFDLNDFIMLVMAIHTAMLIIRPQAKTATTDTERGLNPYKTVIIAAILIFPIILNGIVYITASFHNYVTFCYIPRHPLYSRFVSSWAFRFFTILSIFIIYVSIYLYIYMRYTELQNLQLQPDTSGHTNRGLSRLTNLFHQSKMSPNSSHEEIRAGFTDQHQTEQVHASLKDELYRNNRADFNTRRLQIFKNLKFIFVYPVSYFCVWFVPLIAQCYRYSIGRTPIALFCATVWFQAFDGLVQSVIFFIREKPWLLIECDTDVRDDATAATASLRAAPLTPNLTASTSNTTSDGSHMLELDEFLRG